MSIWHLISPICLFCFVFPKANSVQLFNQDSNAAVFTETLENPNAGCPHDFRMNEEIGIYCYRCGFVSTEIKYITPPFVSEV